MSLRGRGVAYVSFAIDVFSRRIVGWKADTTMKTSLVLDTLQMALGRATTTASPLARESFYTAMTGPVHELRLHRETHRRRRGSLDRVCRRRLRRSGRERNGLYKTELINRRGPWKTIGQVEPATAIHDYTEIWHNQRRHHSSLKTLTPTEFEDHHHTTTITG